MQQVIETLLSVPFAVAATSLLRKKWPSIDGWYVVVVVLVCSSIAAVLMHYRSSLPPEFWMAAGPVLATILAMGGVQTLQDVAGKAIPPDTELDPDLVDE